MERAGLWTARRVDGTLCGLLIVCAACRVEDAWTAGRERVCGSHVDCYQSVWRAVVKVPLKQWSFTHVRAGDSVKQLLHDRAKSVQHWCGLLSGSQLYRQNPDRGAVTVLSRDRHGQSGREVLET